MRKVEEWQNVDREVFENEILTANRPAVLRGLLRTWPAVRAGRHSPTSVVNYLKRFDTGGTVNACVGGPEINGRFFYSDDYQSFNFESKEVSISSALDTLAALANSPQPPAIALQAIQVSRFMPAFLGENAMPLLDSAIAPRIWISNKSRIAPHFDINYNIACVVSGSRHFTVFPPDQVGNLYIGPLLTTPAGTPISIVDLRAPDHERFPRFAQALESGQEAVLEPGDAIYIPVLWWHGVESLEPLNMLVNYWWNDALSAHHIPLLSLIHSMVLMSGMPAGQRDAWRELFDCFVFQKDGDPGAHLPPDLFDKCVHPPEVESGSCASGTVFLQEFCMGWHVVHEVLDRFFHLTHFFDQFFLVERVRKWTVTTWLNALPEHYRSPTGNGKQFILFAEELPVQSE